jgi:hypothetical protein
VFSNLNGFCEQAENFDVVLEDLLGFRFVIAEDFIHPFKNILADRAKNILELLTARVVVSRQKMSHRAIRKLSLEKSNYAQSELTRV